VAGKDIFRREVGLTGLVQQTVQIVASHDLTLLVRKGLPIMERKTCTASTDEKEALRKKWSDEFEQ
jgi:hypothetical protein